MAQSKSVNVKEYHYAGFWIRAAATLIDSIILIFLGAIINKMFFDPETLMECVRSASFEIHCQYVFKPGSVLFLLGMTYYAGQLSSSLQATLGMRAFGLKIIDERGRRISFVRACVRYVASLFSGLILGIGYFMIAFTARKQALHDIITAVYVIRTSKV